MATVFRSTSRFTRSATLIGALQFPIMCAIAQEPQPASAQKAEALPKISTKAANAMAEIKALPECSLAKSNNNCRITIDRAHPMMPPTVQMYSGQYITVVVENPYPFERYFLDYTSGLATLKPDVASSVVQGLLPSLQKLGEFKPQGFVEGEAETDVCTNMKNMPKVNPGQVDDAFHVAQVCVEQLARRDIDIYRKLEPLVAPDSMVPVGMAIRFWPTRH